jgi:hypothetical protein
LKDKSKLYDGVMDVLLETGRLVSLKIRKEKLEAAGEGTY